LVFIFHDGSRKLFAQIGKGLNSLAL